MPNPMACAIPGISNPPFYGAHLHAKITEGPLPLPWVERKYFKQNILVILLLCSVNHMYQ